MFNDYNFNNYSRPAGALEVTRRARAQEKAMALLVGGIQAKTSPKPISFIKNILTTLLTSLR